VLNGNISEFLAALQFAENSEKIANQSWFVAIIPQNLRN